MVKVEGCRAGTPGSVPPRDRGFFSIKIQEHCTLNNLLSRN